MQKGVAQGQARDFAGASGTFERVLLLDPGNELALYNLGVIAEHDGRVADARRDYEKALKTDPRFASALYNEAVLLEASKPDRAIELLYRAVDANPKASTAYLHLGRTLAAEGRFHEARKAFDRAVADDSSLRSAIPRSFRHHSRLSPNSTSTQTGSTT